jgi:hypothetical protein
MRPVIATVSLLALLVSAACGRGTATSPTSVQAAGAQITGAFISSGSLAPQSLRPLATTSVAGMIVTISGTSIRATVQSNGTFTLEDVPNGDVEMVFTGQGLESRVGLSGVKTREAIAVTLSLTETAVVLEASRRSTAGEVQVEGRVEAVPPATAPLTFMVGGFDVTTDGSTSFVMGSSPAAFTDLAPGVRVHVKGQSSGAGVLARVVDIQNTQTDLQIPINGIAEEFEGTAASFEFRVDGRLIKGDALTEFFGGSVFADLANGRRVEVKGLAKNGYLYAARMHVEKPEADDDDDDGQDQSASIEGLLTSKSGAAPVLTLIVDGTTVRTTASTTVQRRGDVQDLTVLALGMTLHVVGDRQADGSLNARKIQIKDDASGGLFEIEGSTGGLQGTCPALTFKINGFTIFTDAATTFTPAATGCGAMRNGGKVIVKGAVQADGRVKAASVEPR